MAKVRNVKKIGGSGNVKPIPITHLIPPKFDPIYKLEIVTATETIDVTNLLVEGKFTEGVTNTIGDFLFKIVDPTNTYSDRISEFDTVNLYLDYGTEATTLRFSGKIERKSNTDFIFLSLSGRDLAIITMGVNVNYNSGGSKARSTILKEIILKYFSGVISTTNIEDDLETIEVNYSEVPFWTVVEEICNAGGRDAYVSTSSVFNYFLKGSRENTTEAVVEGINLINPFDFAKDTEEVITKVRVYGKKLGGIPTIAISDSDTSVTQGITKELKIENTNISSSEQAKEVADWEFENKKALPTLGSVESLILPTLSPGEKLKMFSPINNIPLAYYEINSYTHSFTADGSPKTIVKVKKPRLNVPEILKKNIKIKTELFEGDNPNEMDFSLIYDFDTETGGTKTNVEITDGVLKTITGYSTGTWISPEVVLTKSITTIEPRIEGDNLASAQYFIDLTGNGIYTQLAGPNTKTKKVITGGRNVRIKIVLNSATTQVRSVGLLYKL